MTINGSIQNAQYISVCIPTFNRLNELKQCLASVVSAVELSSSDFEVIVSDNASTDGTGKWLEKYSPPSNRIEFRAWSNDRNIGFVNNVNKLIAESRGDYLFFLTDDDVLLPNALATALDVVNSKSPQFIKLACIINLVKTKRCSYYGHNADINDVGNAANFLEIQSYSHVLSGCVVKKTEALSRCLSSSGNVYPSVVMCALSAGSCFYLSETSFVHKWENEIHWDVDVDTAPDGSMSEHLQRDIQLALLSIPDGFLSRTDILSLYKRLIDKYGYVEEQLTLKFGVSCSQLLREKEFEKRRVEKEKIRQQRIDKIKKNLRFLVKWI